MNRKDELKQMYKEIKTQAGVYCIRNRENGRLLVDSTPNLKTLNGKEFTLQMGVHPCRELQADYNQLGKESFEFEVLEVLKVPETGFFDAKDALRRLESKWLSDLQPYGERGYNRPPAGEGAGSLAE